MNKQLKSTDILNQIMSHYLKNQEGKTLTESIIKPDASLLEFKESQKQWLEQSLEQLQKQHGKMLAKSENVAALRGEYGGFDASHYYHFLELGATYMALDMPKKASECFEISMNFPLEMQKAETDDYLQLPCLLKGAVEESAGNLEQASETYKKGLKYPFKTYRGKADYEKSIARVEQKLKNGSENTKKQDSISNEHLAENYHHELPHVDLNQAASELTPKEFTDMIFEGLSPSESWRLFIDGEQQQQQKERGWLAWEQRERGSVSAMNHVISYIKTQVDKPISAETLKEIHKIATTKVAGLNGRDNYLNELVRPGQFRNSTTYLNITVGYNASQEGIEALEKLAQGEKYYGFSYKGLSEYGTSKYHWAINKAPEEFIANRVKTILNDYHSQMAQLVDNDESLMEKLRIIVRAIQQLELTHPFRDGNGRITYALLNLMLLQNKLPPTILFDPNFFDGHSEEELVTQVLKGMENFTFAKKNGFYPGSKTSLQIVKEGILDAKNDEKLNDLLKKDFLRCVRDGNLELVQCYLDNGMDSSILDEFGNNALNVASFHGQTEVAAKLLKHSPQLINQQGQDECSSLYLASYNGHIDTVSLLLEKGADIAIKNRYGLSALDIAHAKGFALIEKKLVDDVNDLKANDKDQFSMPNGTLKNGLMFVSDVLKNDAAIVYAAVKNHGEKVNKSHVFFEGIAQTERQALDAKLLNRLLFSSKSTKTSLNDALQALNQLESARESVFHFEFLEKELLDILSERMRVVQEQMPDMKALEALSKNIKLRLEDAIDDAKKEQLFELDRKVLLFKIKKSCEDYQSLDKLIEKIKALIKQNDGRDIDDKKTIELLFDKKSGLALSSLLRWQWKERIKAIIGRLPECNQLIFEALLSPDVENIIFESGFSVSELLDLFPNKGQAILDKVMANEVLFNRVIDSGYYLSEILKKMDDETQRHRILDFVMTHYDELTLSLDRFHLVEIIKISPDYKDKLFDWILEKDMLDTLIDNSVYDFNQLMDVFDKAYQQEKLMAYLFKEDHFEKIADSSYQTNILVSHSPQYKDKMFQRLMANPGRVKELVKDSGYRLNTMIEAFDDQHQALFDAVFETNSGDDFLSSILSSEFWATKIGLSSKARAILHDAEKPKTYDNHLFDSMYRYPSDIEKLLTIIPTLSSIVAGIITSDDTYFKRLLKHDEKGLLNIFTGDDRQKIQAKLDSIESSTNKTEDDELKAPNNNDITDDEGADTLQDNGSIESLESKLSMLSKEKSDALNNIKKHGFFAAKKHGKPSPLTSFFSQLTN
jgi:Ankyrin repeats (3 copies)/Fic/DOC family